MRLQSNQASCGAATLYNVCCALGMTGVGLDECEKLCGTTAIDGTSVKQLLKAANSLGLDYAEIKEGRADVAHLRLTAELGEGRPGALAVDGDSHWAAVVGMLGDKRLIADSADNELVISLEANELLSRWYNNGSGRTKFYAAVFWRKE